MNITRITYGESYEAVNSYGLKSWNKLAVEIEMEAGESATEAYQTAHQFIKEKLSKQIEEEPVIQKRVTATEPASTEAGIIASIYTCTELKVLESYKMIAKKYPAIQAAYDQQLQKITA